VQGSDGNFYGTTASGGAFFSRNDISNDFIRCHYSAALVQQLFGEGAVPIAGLVEGSDGHFYGTTVLGGTHFQGTVFKIDAAGNFTTVHAFSGSPSEGANPVASLMQGSDANFYGTTPSGGEHFQGTVFRITALVTLHFSTR
jgi:uncharacterized repeat protein (TIGR03803 family)